MALDIFSNWLGKIDMSVPLLGPPMFVVVFKTSDERSPYIQNYILEKQLHDSLYNWLYQLDLGRTFFKIIPIPLKKARSYHYCPRID